MSAHSRSVSIPWGTLFFALCGLAWCGYVAFPTASPAPCITSGCAIFRDFTLFGVSMWWIGGAYFLGLALLCLRGKCYLAWWVARIALGADTILLLAMLFTAPCTDCLIIAVFFGITLICLRPAPSAWFSGEPAKLLLLPIWFGLFIANSCLALDERIPRWALGNKENSAYSVYFSPSCPHCRDALLFFGTSVALYPVIEKPEDRDAILRLSSYLDIGMPLNEALEKCLDPNEPLPQTSFGSDLLLSLHLTRNKATVFRQGFRHMPLIQINGMPPQWKAALPTPTVPTPQVSDPSPAISPRGNATVPSAASDLPWDDVPLGQCGQNTPTPCE